MDYKKVAQEIYDKVGRKENLVSAAHCATRLRLVLVDNAKCDAKAVEDIEGVKGVFSAGEVVAIMDSEGNVFAKAVPYFDSTELEILQGHKSYEIETLLGGGKKDVVFRPEDLAFIINERV